MKINLLKPSRDKPMAVGGMGMLSTSNYAARKFGVRAAMPGTNKWNVPPTVIKPQTGILRAKTRR